MIRTLKGRGLVLLTAAPLLGVVPMAAGANAGGPAPAAHKGPDAAPKPPPRPRTQAKPEPKPEPKAEPKPKPKTKPKTKQDKKHDKKDKAHAKGVVLRTRGPKKDVIPGRTYEWKFKVTAKGPAKSGKAVFRTTLPKSLAFVSGEKRCTSRGRKVVCRLGTVKKGHRVSGVIRAKVSERVKPGQKISVRGTATWGKTRVTRRFPVVRVARIADLAITKTAPAKARAGAKIPYEMKVRNLGPSTAANVTVQAKGPIKVVGRDTACAPRRGGYVCAVGSLRAGESRTLHIRAVPRKDVRAGTVLRSSWKAASPTADADETNNTAVVRTRITKRR